MSLQKLSTELDINIINRLDAPDLSSISCISKYYRRISEPLLYREIGIGSDSHDRIKQLLLTFISRKDLRKLIQRFHLLHADDHNRDLPQHHPSIWFPEDRDGDALYHRLWAHVVGIQEAMESMSRRSLLIPQFKTTWLASIFEPYPFFDGALSLILCLAYNLKTINLEMCARHTISMARCVLQNVNWHNVKVTTPGIPFQQLTHLAFQGTRDSPLYYDVPVLPRLEHLRVERCTDLTSLGKCPRCVETSNLRALHLVDVDLDPDVIVQAIGQTRFQQLTALCVEGVGRGGGGSAPINRQVPWDTYEYPALQRAMAKHLPRLEIFAWKHMLCHDGALYVPFGPFTDFPHLTQLDLDIELVTSAGLEDMPPLPEELRHGILSKLKTLGVCSIQWAHIEAAYKRYLDLAETQPHTITQLVQTLATLNVPSILLEVDIEAWTDAWPRQCYPFSEPAIDLLRQVADALHVLGVELRVEYYLDDPGSGRRLLVAQGFTAKFACYDEYPYAGYRMEKMGEGVVEHVCFGDEGAVGGDEGGDDDGGNIVSDGRDESDHMGDGEDGDEGRVEEHGEYKHGDSGNNEHEYGDGGEEGYDDGKEDEDMLGYID
ncbi:hypothetical protein G6011_04049 [Alternaria panax]|uniref:F-box domain-containing protein n=1 Tax=Alternaria panax TaxID=48097 RepID=A0AAD4IGB9_9PLEO|nr:hypothetical protein G6011_04049 [Alternaria panax]